jgi:hypothetical protein
MLSNLVYFVASMKSATNMRMFPSPSKPIVAVLSPKDTKPDSKGISSPSEIIDTSATRQPSNNSALSDHAPEVLPKLTCLWPGFSQFSFILKMSIKGLRTSWTNLYQSHQWNVDAIFGILLYMAALHPQAEPSCAQSWLYSVICLLDG